MTSEPEKTVEIDKDPRKMFMSGRVILFMKKSVGFKWNDLAREAASYRAEKGGFLCTSASGVKDYMANTRRIKTAYAIVTEKLIGKEQYQTLLEVAYRDRPEWFSEPSAKQR